MRKSSTITGDVSLYQNALAAIGNATHDLDGELNTQSAALDCLADMLGNMGELADQAKEGGQAQTYFALSNSLRAIHQNIGGMFDALNEIRRCAKLEAPAKRG
jgi:hypothetical protein